MTRWREAEEIASTAGTMGDPNSFCAV